MNTIDAGFERYCQERFPLPSEEQIANLESRLSVLLPPSYRQFIAKYNGGFFCEPTIRSEERDCPTDRLTFLGGFNPTHPTAQLGGGSISPKMFDDNYPVLILPIGYTIMGNLLFIVTDPAGDDRGWIELKIAFQQKSYFLAETMEDFFGLLSDPPNFKYLDGIPSTVGPKLR